MSRPNPWSDGTRLAVQAALLALSCGAALAVRRLVEGDTLSDSADLALNGCGLALLVATSLVSRVDARRERRTSVRLSLATLSAAILGIAVVFAYDSYPGISIELADVSASAGAAEAQTSIVLGPDGKDVRLSGDIREGSADQLAALLDANPQVTRIHLTSEGGLAEEGQALGQVIADHELTAYVPDFCVSACTLAFAGGRKRIVMRGARLGYHSPYQEGVFGQTFKDDGKAQRAAYLADGLAADFVDEALKVAPGDMWFPDLPQLVAAHVVTGFVDRYRFPDSNLDGAADPAGAKVALLHNFPVLEAISPVFVDRLANWYLAAYRRDASEGENVEGLRAMVRSALTLAFARADDATLLEIASYLVNGMAVAATPEACAAMGEQFDLLAADIKLDAAGPQADAVATALVRRAIARGRDSVARQPLTALLPIALTRTVASTRSCANLKRIYVEAIRARDASPLRRRLAMQLQPSTMILSERLGSR